MAANDGRFDLGYGSLNNIEEQEFGKTLDPKNTSGFAALRQNLSDSYKKNAFANTGRLKGVVLRVDSNPTNNPITSWIYKLNPLAKSKIGVKVRIPELHAALLEPTKYGPVQGSENFIIDMYPTFIAANDEISNEVPAPGDIVWVDFGNRNNMSDPVYYGIAYKMAQGGAVGRETGRDKFASEGKSPFSVLPPSGDNPITGLGNELNQIPKPLPFQTTRSTQPPMTVGSFTPQKDHVDVPTGLPPINPPEIAFKSGSPGDNVDLIEIPVPIATKAGVYITKSQEKPFYDLINAAKRDGISIQLNSGFRTQTQQQYLYDGFKKGKPGFNLAARPGHSNHQTGIAFDFAVGNPHSKAYGWMATNAHKFGFYNAGRFFKGQKEFWHFEFLGINHPIIVAEGKLPLSEKLRSFA